MSKPEGSGHSSKFSGTEIIADEFTKPSDRVDWEKLTSADGQYNKANEVGEQPETGWKSVFSKASKESAAATKATKRPATSVKTTPGSDSAANQTLKPMTSDKDSKTRASGWSAGSATQAKRSHGNPAVQRQ